MSNVFACLNVYNISYPFMFYVNGPWDEQEVMSSLRLPGFFYLKFLCLFFRGLFPGMQLLSCI